MAVLKDLDIEVSIWTMPQEIAAPIPFDCHSDRLRQRDERHFAYDPESARRFLQILFESIEF
jgi:Family of unknown function (DUF5996)